MVDIFFSAYFEKDIRLNRGTPVLMLFFFSYLCFIYTLREHSNNPPRQKKSTTKKYTTSKTSSNNRYTLPAGLVLAPATRHVGACGEHSSGHNVLQNAYIASTESRFAKFYALLLRCYVNGMRSRDGVENERRIYNYIYRTYTILLVKYVHS